MAPELFPGFYQAIVTPVNILSLLIRNYLCHSCFVTLWSCYEGTQCRQWRGSKGNRSRFSKDPEHTKRWPESGSLHHCREAGKLIKHLCRHRCVCGVLKHVTSARVAGRNRLSEPSTWLCLHTFIDSHPKNARLLSLVDPDVAEEIWRWSGKVLCGQSQGSDYC